MELPDRNCNGWPLLGQKLYKVTEGPAPIHRFPDGGHWRVEIPSVEGPEAVEAVFISAEKLAVPIHRISQGSGVTMLTNSEIDEMLTQCREREVELCLFARPGANWDIGAGDKSPMGGFAARSRGAAQLTAALKEIERGCELGVRSFLTADEGLLWAAHSLRASGDFPDDLQLKVSIMSAPMNPMAFRVNAGLGADTINVSSDLTVQQYAEMRDASSATMDIYIEAPDNVGGFIRHHEVDTIISAAAPVYIKFGLRNAPDVYPSGGQLRNMVVDSARERVRRARLGLDSLHRLNSGGLDMSGLGNRLQPVATRFHHPHEPVEVSR